VGARDASREDETMTKTEILEALKAANAAPFAAKTGAFGGCGRAYVCVSADKATVKLVAAACKALGLLFLKKAYGTTGNAIYIGYDNADGRALAKSEAFAATLTAKGLPAYSDAVAD
jgi:hypothetical protein